MVAILIEIADLKVARSNRVSLKFFASISLFAVKHNPGTRPAAPGKYLSFHCTITVFIL